MSGSSLSPAAQTGQMNSATQGESNQVGCYCEWVMQIGFECFYSNSLKHLSFSRQSKLPVTSSSITANSSLFQELYLSQVMSDWWPCIYSFFTHIQFQTLYGMLKVLWRLLHECNCTFSPNFWPFAVLTDHLQPWTSHHWQWNSNDNKKPIKKETEWSLVLTFTQKRLHPNLEPAVLLTVSFPWCFEVDLFIVWASRAS